MDLYDGVTQVLSDVSAQAASIFNTTQSLLFNETAAPFTLLALVGVVGGAAYYDMRRREKLRRIEEGLKKMTKKERKAYLRKLVGDTLTEAFEQAEQDGKITSSEKKAIYRQIGFAVGAQKQVTPRKMSEQERNSRMNQLKLQFHALFGGKTPNIPGPKPGEGVKTVPLVSNKTGFGAAFLNRKAT